MTIPAPARYVGNPATDCNMRGWDDDIVVEDDLITIDANILATEIHIVIVPTFHNRIDTWKI